VRVQNQVKKVETIDAPQIITLMIILQEEEEEEGPTHRIKVNQ
jgi:hypothetical protein